ncbi:hotdog domain-containing protein [Streptomyces sp. TRM 70361]|uniref:acyl-CoA thioesterase n=1 Tax=Streptomyces sp. TRM 70361 TaxID=3116553 RepID=UPI002E7B0EB3|nr:hotdog domain-containing protein [Streptomyces sp. TRM 70361]MEE1937973.1 hotdog domain-containing protein [Streptomyces sp. TRM 70361]
MSEAPSTESPADAPEAPRLEVTELVDVHFEDLDANGVLHNSRYPVLLEHALGAYWYARGWHHDPKRSASPDTLQVVRAMAITYHWPVTEVGKVAVRFWIDRMGRTSYTYGFEVRSADGSVLHADGTRTHVNLDPATFTPRPFDERSLTEFSDLVPAPATGAGA